MTTLKEDDWIFAGDGIDADYGQIYAKDGTLWVAWASSLQQTPLVLPVEGPFSWDEARKRFEEHWKWCAEENER